MTGIIGTLVGDGNLVYTAATNVKLVISVTGGSASINGTIAVQAASGTTASVEHYIGVGQTVTITNATGHMVVSVLGGISQ